MNLLHPSRVSTHFSVVLIASIALVTACGEQAPSFTEQAQISADATAAAQAPDSSNSIAKNPKAPSVDTATSASENAKTSDSLPSLKAIPTLASKSADVFGCKSDAISLKAGQSANLAWSWPQDEIINYSLVQYSTPQLANAGSLDKSKLSSDGYIIFKAPATIATSSDVGVVAQSIDSKQPAAACKVRLIADSELGIKDDGSTQGIKGNVFQLVSGQSKLPDFSKMKPIDQIIVSNIDVPVRAWSAGFPNVRSLFEWFGIQFNGYIYADQQTQCSFKLEADDGANLYIDGIKVIDNDGTHAVQTVYGSTNLSPGPHAIRVDYFQGPRYHIALVLSRKCTGQTAYEVIPPEAFRAPVQ